MATTATKKYDIPLAAGVREQCWRITVGSSDTTATWKTGLNNIHCIMAQSQDDSSCGQIVNSSDGTEGTSKGDAYLLGVANSAKLDVIVKGA